MPVKLPTDEVPARIFRRELGWLFAAGKQVVTYKQLLAHAEKLYWHNRSTPLKKVG